MSAESSAKLRLPHSALYHVVGGVAFDDFRRAICAWSAVDALVERRRGCLAVMRSNAGVVGDAFSAAAKEEAQLAAQIRRIRRAGGTS